MNASQSNCLVTTFNVMTVMWNIGNVMLIGPGEVLVGQVLEGLHEGLQTSHGQDGGLRKTTEKKKEA